jgi:hypothetical protein
LTWINHLAKQEPAAAPAWLTRIKRFPNGLA